MKTPLLAVTIAAVAGLSAVVAAAPAPHAQFTVAQVNAGSTLFLENCAMCHGPQLQGIYAPALTAPNGKVQLMTVSAVYAYTTSVMPSGNAGSLTPSQYLDIMAFLMERNGQRPGSAPLTNASALADQDLLGGAK